MYQNKLAENSKIQTVRHIHVNKKKEDLSLINIHLKEQ
jgi:hypothetical protein